MNQQKAKKIRQIARRKTAKLTQESINIFKDAVKPKPKYMPMIMWKWLIRKLFTFNLAIIVYSESINKDTDE